MLLLLTSLSLTNSIRICIIGGGPSGLLFCERLTSSHNFPNNSAVDLFESRSNPSNSASDSRAYAIGGHRRLFQSCDEYSAGLSDFIKENGCSLEPKFILYNGGKFDSHITTQRTFSAALLKWIYKKIPAKNPKLPIQIKFVTKCVSVDPEAGIVYYKNADSEELKYKVYDLIIGADGANSAVRQAILTDRNRVSYESKPYPALWKSFQFEINLPSKRFSAARIIHKSIGGLSIFLPTGKMNILYFWSPQSIADMGNPIGFNKVEDIANLVTNLYGNTSIIEDFEEKANKLLASAPSNPCFVKLSRYHHSAGKVVLIGDAAHVMSSFLGQGMATSLLDANSLYKHLSASKWINLKEALEKYSAERVPENDALIDLNFLSYAIPTFAIVDILRSALFRQKTLSEMFITGGLNYQQIANKYKFWIKYGKRAYEKRFSKYSHLYV